MNEYIITFRSEELKRFHQDQNYKLESSKSLTEALQRAGAELTGIASLISVGIKYEGNKEDLLKRLGEEKYDLNKIVIDEAGRLKIGTPSNPF